MEGWKYIKLGDECLVERGGSPRPIEKYITTDNNGINWIKIGDTTDSMFITSAAQKIIPEGQKKSRNVFKGDFLLSNSMSFGRPYILKIDGCIHDGWLVIRDHKKIFNKHFLYYFLSSPKTYEHLKNLAVGGVVNNLNKELVKGLIIPVPPLEKQNEIADKFDKLELLSNLRKQQLANLDQLVKSRFIELFGNPEKNPFCWPKSTIGSLIDLCEAGWSGNGIQREKNLGEIAILKVSAVTKGYFIPSESKVLEDQTKIKKYVFPKKGDLLFSRANTRELVGATAVVTQDYPEYILPDKLWRIQFTKIVDVWYMKYILSSKSIRSIFSAVSTGTSGSMFNVSMEKFKSVVIPVPPLELQNQFTTFVQQVDKSKFLCQFTLKRFTDILFAQRRHLYG